jgi:glycosyltransferase involved in cell wall biosynthesis
MVGPHPYRVKGGISTIARHLLHSELMKEYPIDYVSTMVDGSKLIKIGWFLAGFFLFSFRILFKQNLLVHIQGSHYASFYRKMLFILLAKLAGKKIIYQCHGSHFDIFYDQGPGWQRFLIRWIISLCDRTIALSPQWAVFFARFLRPSCIIVLENPIPLEKYRKKGEKNREFPGPLKILFSGRVYEDKGVLDLLSITPKLVEKFPELKVQFAGHGDLDKFIKMAQTLGVEPQVEFLGWVDPEAMVDLYHQATLFTLPSYHEGFPMVILEAMACGLPVVSTRVGGIPELIEEGTNGHLIEPGDQTALLKGLLDLLTHPETRKIMGEENVRKIKAKYDISIYIDRLKNIYGEILEDKKC